MQDEEIERDSPGDSERKIGALSLEEIKFIQEVYKEKTVEEIGELLNRNPESIRKYLHRFTEQKSQEKAEKLIPEPDDQYNLRRRPYWSALKGAYTDKELRLMLYEWKRIVHQFKNEVQPTEELQILDLIKVGIEQLRAEQERQNCTIAIKEYEDKIKKTKRKLDNGKKGEILTPEEEKELILEISNLEKMSTSLRQAQRDYSISIKTYLEQKGQIMKELKATRDQRLKKFESSNANFTLWLQRLYSDSKLRKEMSIELEKMRLASNNATI